MVGYSGRITVSNQFAIQKINSNLGACSYIEYESELATYGQCGKFGIDTANNKFKVPFIKDGSVIQQALTNEEVGKSYSAGLPDITASWAAGSGSTATGAAYISGTISGESGGSGGTDNACYFNASRSSEIYGNSETVQMNAIAAKYFVVVANGQLNQSQMDWSAWASSLQSKMNTDHSNDSKPYIVEVSDKSLMPSWYRVWSDGWCEQGGEFVNASTITFLKPFIDTNYSISINYLDSTAATTISISYLAPRRTVNDFTLSSSSIKRCWKASGYIN